MSLSISKRDLHNYVNLKIKRMSHHYHVFAIITLLFEELIKDMIAGKTIKIANFGTICLKQMSDRHYMDVVYKQKMKAKGKKIIRIVLTKPVRRVLCAALDLDSFAPKI